MPPALAILYPNGQIEAVQMFVWDTIGQESVKWDGSVTFSGSITVGNVELISAGSVGISRVSSSVSSVQLLAANSARLGCIIVNDSTSTLFVKFGTTSSATSFTYKLTAGLTLEFPYPCYVGRVDGIWDIANGSAQVTEVT